MTKFSRKIRGQNAYDLNLIGTSGTRRAAGFDPGQRNYDLQKDRKKATKSNRKASPKPKYPRTSSKVRKSTR